MKTIIFLGTPEISASLLKQVVTLDGFKVIGVVTQPDKVRGKKKELVPSPVALIAKDLGLPTFKPEKLNKDYGFIETLKPDLLLTFAYGQLISSKVLALSKYQALNLHGSLLPKYRGAAPIQYALKNGDNVTGITLMAMVKAMDAGAIYAKKEIEIEQYDNYTTLSSKLTNVAFEVIKEYLLDFFAGNLVPVEQDETKVTFSPSIKPEEEHLDLSLSKREFVNLVRSLALIPGGYLLDDKGANFKILQARVLDDLVVAPIGTIVKAHKKDLFLQLKDGCVALELIQRPGKKVMSAGDFNNGSCIEGKVFF